MALNGFQFRIGNGDLAAMPGLVQKRWKSAGS
jgi:hypothetical protein